MPHNPINQEVIKENHHNQVIKHIQWLKLQKMNEIIRTPQQLAKGPAEKIKKKCACHAKNDGRDERFFIQSTSDFHKNESQNQIPHGCDADHVGKANVADDAKSHPQVNGLLILIKESQGDYKAQDQVWSGTPKGNHIQQGSLD
jgi:hypothetical protein